MDTRVALKFLCLYGTWFTDYAIFPILMIEFNKILIYC